MRIITELELETALENQRLREYDLEGDSGETIIQYVMSHGATSLKDIMDEVILLCNSHQLRSLVDRGFLQTEISDEVAYSLTEKGKLGIQTVE